MPILFTERRDIETALGMDSGYVLDFSNRTFAEFIAESIGIDIYAGPFSGLGGSKAKHLRCFFEKASDYQVGRLLADLVTHARKILEDEFYKCPSTNILNPWNRLCFPSPRDDSRGVIDVD